MKKGKIVNCDGTELEAYFPANKDWVSMTGGTPDQLASYYEDNLEGQSQIPWGDYESEDFYKKLNSSFLNKIKGLKEPTTQINIDDTIASDFVGTGDLRNGAIYKVAGLNLIAKLVEKIGDRLADTKEANFSVLLKMKRHGTVFYVDEGTLMKATDLEVQNYLED